MFHSPEGDHFREFWDCLNRLNQCSFVTLTSPTPALISYTGDDNNANQLPRYAFNKTAVQTKVFVSKSLNMEMQGMAGNKTDGNGDDGTSFTF